MVWKLKKSKTTDDDDNVVLDSAPNVIARPDDSDDFATGIGPQEADFSADPAEEVTSEFYAERMAAVDEAIASLTNSKKLNPPAPEPVNGSSAAPASEPAPLVAGGDEDDWSLDAFAPYKPPQRSAAEVSSPAADSGLGIGHTGLEGLVGGAPPTEEIDFTGGDSDQPAGITDRTISLDDDLEPIPVEAATDQEEANWLFSNPDGAGDEHVVIVADTPVAEEPERTLPYVHTGLESAGAPAEPTLEFVPAPAPAVLDDDRTLTHVDISDPVMAAIPVELAPPAPVLASEPVAAAASASPMTARPRLEVKLGQFTATYDITADETIIGRPDPKTGDVPDIAIEWDDAISRRHAHVLASHGEYYIEDMGSKNGTFVNGRPVTQGTPVALVSGDTIHVGERTEILFIL